MAKGERPVAGHPLVARTLQSLTKGVGEPLALAAPAATALKTELEALAGKAELLDAVHDLAQLGWFLSEKEKSPTAGKALLTVLESAVPLLRELGARAEQAVDAIRESNKKLGNAGPAQGAAGGLAAKTSGGFGLRKRR